MRRLRPAGAAAATRLLLASVLAAGGGRAHAQSAADPLPSWNEGPVKQSIVAFVQRVTTPGGSGFVPVEDRVATFDNDGTLWPERPLPVEVYFVLERVRALAQADPALRQRQPFKAALEGDAAYFHAGGEQAVAQLMAATHGGMTQEEFARLAGAWAANGRHPALDRPVATLAYQPMLELLAYLAANGFQSWICSGGTQDFVRVVAPRLYGIAPERVIGSELRRETRRVGNRLVVYRLPQLAAMNDGEGKPVGIDLHLGRRPLFAAGNVRSGGDVAMLEYSKGRDGPSFQLLVNHDDAAREFAYAEPDHASLGAAARLGFVVVSMRGDWNRVYADRAGDGLMSRRE